MTKKTESTPDATELTPAAFDLAAWLEGLEPTKATYKIDEVEFTLQARNHTWRQKYLEDAKELGPVDSDMGFLAAHIVSPEMDAEQLKLLNDVRPAEVGEMLSLAIELDTKPAHSISPRFLR